jgi:hypothetical protein
MKTLSNIIMKKLLLILFILPFWAQSQDSLRVATVQKFTYTFKVENQQIVGQGWDSLKKAIAQSQFVLIGENHASPKLSELMSCILPQAKSFGFEHFILETGPVASQKVVELYNADLEKYRQNLYTFLTQYGIGIGNPPIEFVAMKKDAEMFQAAVKNGYKIQGIDKEYLYATHYLLDELGRMCTDKGCMQRHKQAVEAVKQHYANYAKKEEYQLITQLKNDLKIKDFVENMPQNSDKLRFVISQLRKSWEIYGLYNDRQYYLSEAVRIENLKRNFGEYYRQHKAGRMKAIIKYGNMHTEIGESGLGFLDLGNTIFELSNINNTQSLHIMNMRRFRDDEKGGVTDYRNDGYEVYPNFIDLADKNQWVVVDLRPIRRLLNQGKIKVNREEKLLIRKNDWILFTPIDGAYQSNLNYK